MKQGEVYSNGNSLIFVCRVSPKGRWADIYVQPIWPGAKGWEKRQPLLNGEFAFEAKKVQAVES